mmetsp:Transcript_166954/g.320802  ORF Transcript_166954/g.320802 Transcript_166954/m.320802 type:complete len:157 (-) Transcript_166954:17-487(-)
MVLSQGQQRSQQSHPTQQRKLWRQSRIKFISCRHAGQTRISCLWDFGDSFGAVLQTSVLHSSPLGMTIIGAEIGCNHGELRWWSCPSVFYMARARRATCCLRCLPYQQLRLHLLEPHSSLRSTSLQPKSLHEPAVLPQARVGCITELTLSSEMPLT